MICYQKTNGLAHDLRLVAEDHVALLGEILLEGDELPSAASLSDAAALAAQAKLGQRAEVDAQRDASLADGTVAWNGKNWHTDATFQLHLAGFVTAFDAGLLAPSATVAMRTADNETLQLGQADVKALAGAVMVAVQTIWAQSWAAKDAIGA